MKMTKGEAKALAKQGIDNSKKYGIPLKQKRKNKFDYLKLYGHLLYNSEEIMLKYN
ncbi:hypothetical protein JMN23_25930 [Bacillus sp. RHFB]|nr:hypothetical protein [Bacillus sp. RHFB]